MRGQREILTDRQGAPLKFNTINSNYIGYVLEIYWEFLHVLNNL